VCTWHAHTNDNLLRLRHYNHTILVSTCSSYCLYCNEILKKRTVCHHVPKYMTAWKYNIRNDIINCPLCSITLWAAVIYYIIILTQLYHPFHTWPSMSGLHSGQHIIRAWASGENYTTNYIVQNKYNCLLIFITFIQLKCITLYFIVCNWNVKIKLKCPDYVLLR